MAEPSGFELVPLPLPHAAGAALRDIVQVTWDSRLLSISLMHDSVRVSIIFEGPISFRSQDEADMLHYWGALRREGAPDGTVYTVKESPYLDEIRAGGTTVPAGDIKHYLVTSDFLCVEVLSENAPVVG